MIITSNVTPTVVANPKSSGETNPTVDSPGSLVNPEEDEVGAFATGEEQLDEDS
jgi:hypothetical protein